MLLTGGYASECEEAWETWYLCTAGAGLSGFIEWLWRLYLGGCSFLSVGFYIRREQSKKGFPFSRLANDRRTKKCVQSTGALACQSHHDLGV